MAKQSAFAARLDSEDPEKQALRDANRSLSRKLAEAKSRNSEFIAAIERAAYEASVTIGAPKVPARPARDKRRLKEEVALIHTTDWQIGKRTESYDTQIAKKRLATEMTATIETFVDLKRKQGPVREAHYLFGGDMVEGTTIFPGQVWEVDSTMFEQLFEVVNIAEAVLLHALGLFDTVHVWEEEGNHGRIGRKGENPDNLDSLAYRITRERFRNEKRIMFHPRPSGHFGNVVEIGTYKALLFHGDEIKNFGGNLPAFGILRKCTKWRTIIEFTDAYHGHFHTPTTLVLPTGNFVFGTGSPESGNTYALEFMAETGEPTQRIHFIDPQRGRVTGQHIINFAA